jgi:hypothetical protein
MAPRKTSKPGKTAQYYRDNPDAYKKKLAYDTKENKSEKDKKYRAELNGERRKRGVYGKGGDDMSHTKGGKIVPEDPKTNRARKGKK